MKQIDLCTVTVKSLCCFSVILQNFNFRAFGSKQLKGSIVTYFGVNGQHQAIGLWDKVGYRLNCSFGLQRQPRIRGRPVISERKGSAQASPIDTSCYPYFTGFEPPVSRLLRQFWVRFIPDQFKSTQGLQVHQKVFQQAGRINMAQSHSPSPERILREGKPVRVLVKPDAQASEKDRSLERISLLRHLKLNASTNGAFCKITGSVQHLQATNRKLAPTTSEYLPHCVRSPRDTSGLATYRPIWRPTPIPDPPSSSG